MSRVFSPGCLVWLSLLTVGTGSACAQVSPADERLGAQLTFIVGYDGSARLGLHLPAAPSDQQSLERALEEMVGRPLRQVAAESGPWGWILGAAARMRCRVMA